MADRKEGLSLGAIFSFSLFLDFGSKTDGGD